MLSQALRAYVRQEELDESLRSSLCALRLIKTRTQVAQEMKLPAGVAEIAPYKLVQDSLLFLGDAPDIEGDVIMTRASSSFFIKI